MIRLSATRAMRTQRSGHVRAHSHPRRTPQRTAFVLAILCATINVTGSIATAEPPQGPAAHCTQGGLVGHSFLQRPRGRAEYRFAGACSTRDGDALVYRVTGAWAGARGAGDPSVANASEVFEVDRASGASESFTGVVGYHCPDDPWLHDVQCTRIGADLSPGIGQFWRQLAAGDTPTSRQGVPGGERRALIDEYRRANGQLAQGARANQRVQDDLPAMPGRGVRGAGEVRIPERRVEPVELNPQPLPPVDDGATPARDDRAATEIIIVGGKPVSTRLRRDATGAASRVVPQTSETRP